MSDPKQLHQIHRIYVIHDLAKHQVFYLVLSLLSGNMQRRVHVLGGGIHLGAMLQQQHNDVHVAQTGCNVQWCLLFACSSINLGSIAQKNAYNIGLWKV